MANPSSSPNRGRPKTSDRPAGRGHSDGGDPSTKAKSARRETERERRERNRSTSGDLPSAVTAELRSAIGEDRSGGLERRLALATRAYERDRYKEALAELRVLVRLAPEVAAVRELYGLTLYRLGRWRDAARELRVFHDLTGSFDQHPVIADCERALGRDKQVLALWDALRQAGVDREVLVEGRLVVAGMYADEGKMAEAIELLAPGAKRLRHPDRCHLRQWYALADCYERAGDLPRARELFGRVAEFDEGELDAERRLAALR